MRDASYYQGLKTTRGENADKPLSEQQRLFVRFHVHEQMNVTAAARAAGYKGNASVAGMSLMKNPAVLKAIERAQEEYRLASQMTRKKVIDGFLEAIDLARMQSEPASMIAGWREVGRVCGLYEPTKTRMEVSVNGSVTLQRLETMTDAELLQLMHEQPEALPSAIEGEFSVDESEDQN
jgi:phage terminase small subunit